VYQIFTLCRGIIAAVNAHIVVVTFHSVSATNEGGVGTAVSSYQSSQTCARGGVVQQYVYSHSKSLMATTSNLQYSL